MLGVDGLKYQVNVENTHMAASDAAKNCAGTVPVKSLCTTETRY